MKDTFIFTIGYNCGLILNKCLESFHKLHDVKVHVFGTYKDFKQISRHKNNEYIELSGDMQLKELYKNGHIGTAYIFSKIINGDYTKLNNIIHFDSDIIFREECISDIVREFENGSDLIGPRRSYEKNLCNRVDLVGLKDVVSTYFMGFNKEKIGAYDFNTLTRMVVVYYNPLNHPILDFFDPISFDILKNNGKVSYLGVEDYGSMDENGSKTNSFGELNTIMDFGKKLAHFAGVGSGMNFYYNGNGTVPETYSEWAKKRFALYMKTLHNTDLNIEANNKEYEVLKPYFS